MTDKPVGHSSETAPGTDPGAELPASNIDDIARGWVLPTHDEIAVDWESAEIVLDANVLLNLYRYSAKARVELLSLLERIADRLWAPHQVIDEFFRGRMSVRVLDETAEEKLSAAVDQASALLTERVNKMNAELGRRNEPPPHEDRIRDALDDLREAFSAAERERSEFLGSHRDDDVLTEVCRLFRDRVGPTPSPQEREKLLAQGRERYERKIPPGHEDDKKDSNAKYGDWFIWRQILDHATVCRRPIIFVTDDGKRDWVWDVHGRKFGARPELIREIYAEAGVGFLLYPSGQFITEVRDRILEDATALSDSTVEEARDLASSSVAPMPSSAFIDSPNSIRLSDVTTGFAGMTGGTPVWNTMPYVLVPSAGVPSAGMTISPAALSGLALRPSGEAAVMLGRAVLTLANPGTAPVAVRVRTPDREAYEVERWAQDGQSILTATFPDDFAESRPARPGKYAVQWLSISPDGARREIATASFSLPAAG